MKCALIVLACIQLLAGCSTGLKLTEEELKKLDPRLQFVFDGNKLAGADVERTTLADGTLLVGVIVHCSSPDDLNFLGERIRTKMSNLVTATISGHDLRRVLRLKSVERVEASVIHKTP